MRVFIIIVSLLFVKNVFASNQLSCTFFDLYQSEEQNYDAKDGNWIFFENFSAAEANITVFDDRLDLQIIDRKSGVISTSFFPADFQYPSMQIQVAYSGATNIVSLKCRPRKN